VTHLANKLSQLLFVQRAICVHTTACIHRVGLYFRDDFGHVSGVQTAGQEDWHVNCFAYALAACPVVRASGAA
jgi:hypothetical protein